MSASISSVPRFLNGRKLRDYQVGTRPAVHAMCEHDSVPMFLKRHELREQQARCGACWP